MYIWQIFGFIYHIYNPHVRNVSLVHTLLGIAAGITLFQLQYAVLRSNITEYQRVV